jgi:Ca2+-binding RTX toxin-like protein
MIGINLSGAEFGSGMRHGYDYHYPDFNEIKYYVDRGVELIRLPFMWERMQPTLGGALATGEIGLLKQFLADAHSLGVKVIIDLHNYGRYGGQTIGSATGPTSAQFADFWHKLASAVKGSPALVGYDIMNEPHDMGGAGIWKGAAQAAVNAIRGVDMNTTIHIEGEGWSGAHSWLKYNSDLILSDPANRLVYHAHQYLDKYSQGFYANSYDGEAAHAMVGVDRLKPFVDWLKANNLKGFIGELGVPSNDPRWLEAQKNMLDYMAQVGLDGTAWGGGFWWPSDYVMFMGSPSSPDTAFFKQLQGYMDGITVTEPVAPLVVDATIYGTAGNDTLWGTIASDRIDGREGDDVLNGSQGADTMIGGSGNDTANYYGSWVGVNVDLARATQLSGDADGDTLSGIENVRGSRYSDNLKGDGGRNTLDGRGGNDVLNGGGGADVLTGGGGNDRFVFDSAQDAHGDRITDWSRGDSIDFSAIDANVWADGNQAFTYIGKNAFTYVAGQLRIYVENNQTFVAGDLNGDGVPDFTLSLAGTPNMSGLVSGLIL